MKRRTYLVGTGTTLSALLAGCTDRLSGDDSTDDTPDDDSLEGDDSPGSDDSPDENDDGESGDNHGDSDDQQDAGAEQDSEEDIPDDEERVEVVADSPQAAVESYIAASSAEDEDAIAEVMHSEAPLNPDNLENVGFGFEPFDAVRPEQVAFLETEFEVPADRILELEQATFWFEDADLSEMVGDTVTLVTVETGHDEIDRELDTWVLSRESEQWRVFYVGTDEIPELDLEDLREPAIRDEEGEIVASVEWDVEPYVDDFEPDDPLVDVQLVDSPEREADAIRIETAVAGGNMEFPGHISGSGAIEFDPDGDQLEVIVVANGEETVVHREHYEP